MVASVKTRRVNQTDEGLIIFLYCQLEKGEPSGTWVTAEAPGLGLPSPGLGAHGLIVTGFVFKALRRREVASCKWRRDGQDTACDDQCHGE